MENNDVDNDPAATFLEPHPITYRKPLTNSLVEVIRLYVFVDEEPVRITNVPDATSLSSPSAMAIALIVVVDSTGMGAV